LVMPMSSPQMTRMLGLLPSLTNAPPARSAVAESSGPPGEP
jgi:hypothetical protein